MLSVRQLCQEGFRIDFSQDGAVLSNGILSEPLISRAGVYFLQVRMHRHDQGTQGTNGGAIPQVDYPREAHSESIQLVAPIVDGEIVGGRGNGFAGAPLSSCESMEDHLDFGVTCLSGGV